MHFRVKKFSLRLMSPCLLLAYRRKYNKVILACLLVTVFSILFISMSAMTVYTRNIYSGNTMVSEVHRVHECPCSVSVPLPFTNQQEVHNKETVHIVRYQYTMFSAPEKNLTWKTLNRRFEDKPFLRTVPEHILRNITLKPNFTRMINATQRVVTVNGSYILENPTLCSTVVNLAVMVIVHTSPNHERRRFAIRTTWANDSFYRHLGNMRILFLLGRTKDPTSKIQTDIVNEFNRYGDILQGDFIDDYHNLTLKGVMAYKWLTERCRNANLILKVDDDISVNIFRFFIDYYPKYRSENMSIICNYLRSQTMLIIREHDSKWFVSNNHFRGLVTYPTDYCSGFFVLLTNDLIPALYRSAIVTPFFWVDDVYLYGLVPGNVPGLKYIGLTGDWYQLADQKPLRCYRNVTATCPFLVAGAENAWQLDELWQEMLKRYRRTLKSAERARQKYL